MVVGAVKEQLKWRLEVRTPASASALRTVGAGQANRRPSARQPWGRADGGLMRLSRYGSTCALCGFSIQAERRELSSSPSKVLKYEYVKLESTGVNGLKWLRGWHERRHRILLSAAKTSEVQ